MSLQVNSNQSTQDNEDAVFPLFRKNKSNNKLNFLNKKRLKKQSELIIEKKIAKKITSNYIDKEAELGSDNEEHDNVVKKIETSSEEDYSDKEDNHNIENLIDDKDIAKNQNDQKDKYINDMFDKDKEEIKKVIQGPPIRKIETEAQREKIEFDDDELPLKLRIERMNNEHYGEDDDIVAFKSLYSKYKSLKKQSPNEEDNEELNEAMKIYQINAIKKVNQITKTVQKEIKERMKDNTNILKNVVMLNKKNKDKEKSNNTNGNLLVKGNSVLKNKSSTYKSMVPTVFGGFANKRNSFLYNFKNENNGNNILQPLKKTEEDKINNSFTSISAQSSQNGNFIIEKKLPSFSNNLNINRSTLNARVGNLTTLFTRKNK